MNGSAMQSLTTSVVLSQPLIWENEITQKNEYLTELFEKIIAETDVHPYNREVIVKRLYHHFTKSINHYHEDLRARILKVVHFRPSFFKSEYFTVRFMDGKLLAIDKLKWSVFSDYFNRLFSNPYFACEKELFMDDLPNNQVFKIVNYYVKKLGSFKEDIQFYWGDESGIKKIFSLYDLADHFDIDSLRKDIEEWILFTLKVYMSSLPFYEFRNKLELLTPLLPRLSENFKNQINQIFGVFGIDFSLCSCGVACIDPQSTNTYHHLVFSLIPLGIRLLNINYFYERDPDQSISSEWVSKGGKFFSNRDLSTLLKKPKLLKHVEISFLRMKKPSEEFFKSSLLKQFCDVSINLKVLVLGDFKEKHLRYFKKIKSLEELHLLRVSNQVQSSIELSKVLNEMGQNLQELTWPQNLFFVNPQFLKLPNLKKLNLFYETFYEWEIIRKFFGENPHLKKVCIIGGRVEAKEDGFYFEQTLAKNTLKFHSLTSEKEVQIISPLLSY